jgi:transcription initiation factor TFIIIB Brf1 subunit/transcription initiation factor TFIIB
MKKQAGKAINRCSKCGENSLITEFLGGGEEYCSNKKCGAVVKKQLIDYATDETKKDGSGGRTGPPENIMVQGGTMMEEWNMDAAGHEINDNIKERGAVIFRKFFDQKMLAGRTTLVFAASCLYAACRESGQSRTIKDFMKYCNCETKQFKKYFRWIKENFDLKTEIMSPKEFISRIASRTEPPISPIIERLAINVVDQLNEKEGKDPVGLAAAALSYVCRSKNKKYPTLRNIALAANVNEVTVRNRIKDIEKLS